MDNKQVSPAKVGGVTGRASPYPSFTRNDSNSAELKDVFKIARADKNLYVVASEIQATRLMTILLNLFLILF